MNYGFWDKLILRGIEGIIQDEQLRLIAQGHTDLLMEFYEARSIAGQEFARMRGWV